MDFKAVISDKKLDSLQVLTALVAGIRPGRLESTEFAASRIRELIVLIKSEPELKSNLVGHLTSLNAVTSSTALFTQSGLISSGGFFSDVKQKIKHAILPPLSNPEGLETALNTIFNKPWDHKWVNELPDSLWQELFREINFRVQLLPDGPELHEVLNSILILSHRIVVLGLDPLLVKKVPGISNLDSPFFRQNKEVSSYVDRLRALQTFPGKEVEEYKSILNTLGECLEKLRYVHVNKDVIGASLGLTYQTIKLKQHLLLSVLYNH